MLMALVIGQLNAWGETITFVQTSASAGTLSANEGISYTFVNTFTSNKEQITSGNTMTLTLSGFRAGDKITGITLNLHNNKSSGAGTVTATFGGTGIGTMNVTGLGNSYQSKSLTVTEKTLTEAGALVILINCSANSVYCNHFEITYETSTTPTAAAPTFWPAAGTTFNTPQNVTITSSTQDAVIYYTTDGATPTTRSTLYEGPFEVAENMTIKAIATKSGMDNSAVSEVTYSFKVGNPYIGVDNASTTSKTISIYCSKTPGATIYYTIDGSDPSTSSTRVEYTGPFTLGKSATVKAYAVYGNMEPSEVEEKAVELKVATPTFNPVGGTYASAQSVTLACATEGATIYYTTDGSTPTTSSSVFAGPIAVSATTTIKAFAVYGEMDNSDVASATYTIGEMAGGTFIKALSESDLMDGMQVIIVNEDAGKTMGEQQTNNFSTVGVTIDNSVATPDDGVTIMTLEGSAGAWYFKTDNGYLYAASSGSNHLKTENEADNNAKATISFSNGDATIKFQGSNTRNWLRYNSSSTLFSCYGSNSNQQAVQIYYHLTGAVSKPVITPASGSITEETEITMTCATEGAVVYYTTDGSNPIENGKLSSSAKQYSGALTFNKAVTIKAVAVGQDGIFSAVTTASYSYTGTVSVPYYENFDEGLGNFTTAPSNYGSKDVKWEFQTNNSLGEERKYAFVSGGTYNSKSDYDGEDRLTSPWIDLSGLQNASMNFIHAGHWFGTASNGADTGNEAVDLAAKKASCHLQVRVVGGEWVDISDRISNWFVQRRENNHNMYDRVNSGDIDLSDYVGQKIQISFYFTSTSSQSGTWNVLKFSVTGTEPEVDNYETVTMKTSGYVSYVVQNDIDWVKTLDNNNAAEGIDIHGYKVVKFTPTTVEFVEFGHPVSNADHDAYYSEPMIPAETPIILKGTAGDNLLVIAKSDDVITKPVGNLLKASYGDVAASADQHFLVLQKEKNWTEEDPYNNYAFFKVKAGRTIPNRKAYLNGGDVSEDDPSAPNASPAIGVYMHDDATDGIAEVGTATPAFDLNGTVYDLSGRRVDGPLRKGIYIISGRKVIIK